MELAKLATLAAAPPIWPLLPLLLLRLSRLSEAELALLDQGVSAGSAAERLSEDESLRPDSLSRSVVFQLAMLLMSSEGMEGGGGNRHPYTSPSPPEVKSNTHFFPRTDSLNA